MNRLNRIFHNKPIKALWLIKSFIGYYLIPKQIFQNKLKKLLDEASRRPDFDYICKRVNYYNRLKPETCLPMPSSLLRDHKYHKKLLTAYFFDTYRYTRYFDDTLYWNTIEGDVDFIPKTPSIVKSRPIQGENSHAVLLNLNKIRHFVFIKDKIPFQQKQDRAIFRAAIHGRPHREKFVRMYFGSECCDVGISVPKPEYPKEWLQPHLPMYDHLHYKFIMAIEGNDVATNLKWIMSSNSLAVMPKPSYETWFMEGTLIPDYHYIEIKNDYSDLEEKMRYYIDHPEQAEAIIAHAHEYIRQFQNKKREKLISLLVMQKYFDCTNPTEEPDRKQHSKSD